MAASSLALTYSIHDVSAITSASLVCLEGGKGLARLASVDKCRRASVTSHMAELASTVRVHHKASITSASSV